MDFADRTLSIIPHVLESGYNAPVVIRLNSVASTFPKVTATHVDRRFTTKVLCYTVEHG